MARGRDKHQARKAAVAALGRELSRRARSKCELCGESRPLHVVEVAGNPDPEADPEVDWALLLCDRCIELRDRGDGADARFLAEACWAELRPTQLTTVRILQRIAPKVPWAAETLEGLYLDPEVEALV
jgi:protein PhnA